ncbi:putative molybdenum cofactor sulfurtransferase [Rosa chinensis]|uniref:Putative molybdenum cofactor sulfurtransferase n=1 Tax=Rosa chinensis TaxID=74649 RepID=A0A2P6RRW1_ROSCH|nr:putative molybdenum cofactor sulfurtransferase [Rosa chinensis]
MDVLKISMSPPQEIADGVSIWEWFGAALDEGVDASKWFSDYLGKPSRLVHFNASLDTLNEHLKDPVPINRFRPNILVDGCEPFSEDLWTNVRINNFTFQCCMLCFRCQV